MWTAGVRYNQQDMELKASNTMAALPIRESQMRSTQETHPYHLLTQCTYSVPL